MSVLRFAFSGKTVAGYILVVLVFLPSILESKGCSFSKFQKQQIQLVWEMTEKRSENFLGLGLNNGADSWENALAEAKLEAESAITENIHIYVKTLNRFVTESKRSKDSKEVTQTIDEFILSISEANLRKVEYTETGRLYCDSKYYIAVIAAKNKSDYFKEYLKYLPTTTTPMINDLFKNTDKEFLKEIEITTGKYK